MSSLNLNEYVRVRLTDYGKDVYYHQYDEFNRRRGYTMLSPRMPNVDEDGYTKFQLWEFMHIYGHTMQVGSRNVIDPIELYFGLEDDNEFD